MPKTTFNQPPNLPELEEDTLKFWQDNKIFQKSIDSRPADKRYTFYDGPPFATGLPHYGHLLGSTSKDVIGRYWTMKGYRVERVWGWDCHGLPIENMLEKQLKIKGGKKGIEKLGINNFNQACRTEVLRLDKEWEKIIGRLGRWVDFKHNYKTMDASYMESVWWGFQELHKKDLIYEGRKVILYCPRCATPLSNFEIAMDNSYKEVTGSATTYKYKVIGQKNTYLLAWSTTPWNKIATPALAVNANLDYVKVQQNQEFYILAKDRLDILNKEAKYEVKEQLTGKDLTKLEFEPHYDFYPNRKPDERTGVIIADDFVTADEGTGVVTLAIYGEDDYRVMKRENIQLVEHVDEEGKLKAEVKPWAGLDILEANPFVNKDLEKRGLIYQDKPHTHNVATCYRCSTRLYYAPLPAWFINIAKLRPDLIKQNEKINWYPDHLKHGRFLKGLENAPDWNISRSRYWGTPMPIWKNTNNPEKIRIIGSVKELKKWAVDPKQLENLTDIHREFLDDVEVWIDDEKTIKGKRISEVFDCWVESGSMPFASIHYPFENKDQFESSYPAQFVSEYIAQTRAWFYTMHVMSVGVFGKHAVDNILTTGTILAKDGAKMSKSKKNYPDPMLLINKYGVDSLRLYMMSSTVMKGENLNFNEKEVFDIRRKTFIIWWNVISFFKTFADQDVDVTTVPANPQHILDQWLLAHLAHTVEQLTEYLDNYDVVRASRTLISFVTELSTWYLRLSRDRLRGDTNKEPSQALGHTLYTLAQLFAPLAPFFSELAYHNLTTQTDSIHLSYWPKHSAYKHLAVSQLETEMTQVKKLVELGHAQRKEKAVKVRQPLASVKTTLPDTLKHQDQLAELITQELNVKKVEWQKTTDALPTAELNFSLTPELKEEGEAREVMRSIQKLRRKAKLKVEDKTKAQLPSWPEKWQKEIEAKTNTTLVKGDVLTLLQ